MRIQLFEKLIELNYISRVIPKKLTTNIVRHRLLFNKTDKKNTNLVSLPIPRFVQGN
jgi:hypothetical protein